MEWVALVLDNTQKQPDYVEYINVIWLLFFSLCEESMLTKQQMINDIVKKILNDAIEYKRDLNLLYLFTTRSMLLANTILNKGRPQMRKFLNELSKVEDNTHLHSIIISPTINKHALLPRHYPLQALIQW